MGRVEFVLAGMMLAAMARGKDAPGRLTCEVASIGRSTADGGNA
ncbi:MAG TPA: hypothetical protein VFC39_17110 [Acidobacteriaceae bacterium]|nr:hypothetical protein [Acidobacteriaceae bacterium]